MNKKRPEVTPPVVNLERYEEFKVKISQLVPFDLNFGNMTLTEYELLVMTIYRLNELIGIVNMYSTTIDEVLEWVIGDGLQESVLMQLNAWLVDGTLEDLINEALFNSKLDKVDFEEFKSSYELYKTEQEDVNIGVANYLDSLNDLKLDKEIFNTHKDQQDINNTNFQDYLNLLNSVKEDKKTLESLKLNQFLYGADLKGINFLHRGLSQFFPENSAVAFDMAGLMGGKGIEIDVWATSDGVLVCSHDNTLSSMTDTEGYISSSTASYVLAQQITKGNNVDKYAKQNMSPLDGVLYTAQRYGMHVLVEIKPNDLSDSILTNLINMIKSRNMVDSVGVMSFDENVIRNIRRLDDDIVVGLVTSSPVTHEVLDNIISIKNCFISIAFTTVELANTYQAICDEKSIPCTFWTVNDFPTANNLAIQGIKSITTDYIRGMKPIFNERAYTFKIENSIISVDYRFGHDRAWVNFVDNTIEVNYGVPFTANDNINNWKNRRIGVATTSLSSVSTKNMEVKVTGETPLGCVLYVYVDGVIVDPRTVYAYFNVTVRGLDFGAK